jgi:hypothetical protein
MGFSPAATITTRYNSRVRSPLRPMDTAIQLCTAAWESFLVRYLPPYEVLKTNLSVPTAKGELMVSCRYETFVHSD